MLVYEGGVLQKVDKVYNMVGVSFKEFAVECSNVFHRKGIKKLPGGGVLLAFLTREYWPGYVNRWASDQSVNAVQYLCKNGRDEGYLF
jgi:hypothetical protein